MIFVLVSALMWVLFTCLLVLRRGRVERSITYAALAIAVAMTLNIDPLYMVLDGLAGGTNLVTLVADLALTVGVFFLGRGVMKASQSRPLAIRLALGRAAIVTAVLGAVVAFFFIDRGATTTSFMIDLGAQPAAAAYSMMHFNYFAIVLSAMAALAARQLRGRMALRLLPPASLLVGSVFGLLFAGVVITMDVAHVSGSLDLMTSISAAYAPLFILTFGFLCLGFASQPAVRSLQASSRQRTTRGLILELDPVWRRAINVRPGISQMSEAGFHADEPEATLHREVVEIRDAMIDARVTFDLSGSERELVERAERHLIGGAGSESSQYSRSAVRATREQEPR